MSQALANAVADNRGLYNGANFTIGFINNLGYVMIGVGAQAISASFGQANLMPMFQLMLVIFSGVIKIINVRYLLTVNHLTRVIITTVFMIIGFVLMSIATSANASWGFGVSMVATLFTGLASSWGEALAIGFMKFYPPEFVGSFSSGTGLAGVGGVAFMLGLRAAGLADSFIFIIMLPFTGVYFVAWYFIYNRQRRYGKSEEGENLIRQNSVQAGEITESGTEHDKGAVQEDTGNVTFSWEQIKFVQSQAWWVCLNLGMVYFFEYVIITCFADRVTLHQESGGFFHSNAFLILQFCYQLGVLCSRSSLACVKIPQVWILTILQSLLFVLWWFDAAFIFMDIWSEFAVMIVVGLMGGASYVNVAYIILNSGIIPLHYKETAANVSLIYNNLGIIIATLFSLLLDNTMLKE